MWNNIAIAMFKIVIILIILNFGFTIIQFSRKQIKRFKTVEIKVKNDS